MGVPVMAQGKGIWLASMRMQVGSLASLSGLRVKDPHCCELWCRSQTWLDPVLQWLCRPVTTGPTGPLAWEPSYALGAALKKKKKKLKWFLLWFSGDKPKISGLIPGLAQWVKDPSRLWLWLWHRSAPVAPI